MERFLTRLAEVTEDKDVTNNINIKMIKMRFGSRESDGKMEQALKGASFWCCSLFTVSFLVLIKQLFKLLTLREQKSS